MVSAREETGIATQIGTVAGLAGFLFDIADPVAANPDAIGRLRDRQWPLARS